MRGARFCIEACFKAIDCGIELVPYIYPMAWGVPKLGLKWKLGEQRRQHPKAKPDLVDTIAWTSVRPSAEVLLQVNRGNQSLEALAQGDKSASTPGLSFSACVDILY